MPDADRPDPVHGLEEIEDATNRAKIFMKILPEEKEERNNDERLVELVDGSQVDMLLVELYAQRSDNGVDGNHE